MEKLYERFIESNDKLIDAISQLGKAAEEITKN